MIMPTLEIICDTPSCQGSEEFSLMPLKKESLDIKILRKEMKQSG